jgi:ketosteroid isomerase-like protein
MRKTELLQRWYDEVWSNGNLDMIDELFSPDTVAKGLLPEMAMGPGDFRELVHAIHELVEDITVQLPITVEQDDWLSAVAVAQAKRSDTGVPIQATGHVIARFEGDRMVETYNQFDFMSFFEQLGQMPAGTLPACMIGQRLDWV